MTTNNEAFEKWFDKEFGDAHYPTEGMKLSWQAATTEANKRMEELESEVAELKDAKQDLENEVIHLQEMIAPLQASNHALLEALEENHYSNSSDKAIKLYNDAMYSTPAESLQAHDNELLERAAKICQRKSDDYKSLAISCDEIKDHVGHDICIHKQAVASSIGNAICALKEVK